MAKKKQIIETHGKIETRQPTTLEQVWGFNEIARYGTLNEDDYAAQLKGMNRPELEAHARKVGEVIVESSERLREKLVKGFRSYVSSLNKPVIPSSSNKMTPEAEKILREGR